jgi:uncharacterized protein YcgL (UPF0745 family)
MNCKIYNSERKPETYLYLAEGVEIDDLPEDLQQIFGEPGYVMTLVLSEQRKLAQVNVETVMTELKTNGYFLQLPPKTPTEEQIRNWLS